tara:strand:+ start:285 stop:416 length:132 start_codon:yes stop_codon:yes gene_type:complete
MNIGANHYRVYDISRNDIRETDNVFLKIIAKRGLTGSSNLLEL